MESLKHLQDGITVAMFWFNKYQWVSCLGQTRNHCNYEAFYKFQWCSYMEPHDESFKHLTLNQMIAFTRVQNMHTP